MNDLFRQSGIAIFSDGGEANGLYRYRLERDLGWRGPAAAVIMVNPSTAGAAVNDHTVRRLIGFGEAFRFRKIIVGGSRRKRARRSAPPPARRSLVETRTGRPTKRLA